LRNGCIIRRHIDAIIQRGAEFDQRLRFVEVETLVQLQLVSTADFGIG
jgi:hypothetical protein